MRQGALPLTIHGATYGPFAPGPDGHQFPSPCQIRRDLAHMREAAIDTIRTYHAPPGWLLDEADDAGVRVMVDVPWPKHLCFLDSETARRQAREAVRATARAGRGHPSVLAYSVGNEIPASVVRWHGAQRVERFLAELVDVSKQEHPDGLVTYANYPSTEYLDLSILDFATFNVYLHDAEAFRRYLLHLLNLVGDRPLVLGEIGMDTLRHGEASQAEFLRGHLREAFLLGVAGAFVFSWTDDWHTGGHQIEDWAFGLTRADRTPKPAVDAVGRVFAVPTSYLLHQAPRVSVVVCSYNGAGTLAQCLESLLALDYPDYEVILVDDGSTDDTPAIARRFPRVRYFRQANEGLSAARNAGLGASTGDIVAYTDSDCFADRNWLTCLVHTLRASDADAIGGPNLTPDDGRTAACVAASPGQPTHVLEDQDRAEHVPGCNMAFRRDRLLAIGGFDPTYRKAGDDVDVCWRLQDAGGRIAFAPGAFVWHHRRQTPRTYLRQQAGYGEAEGLLWFAHPHRFNGRGQSKWKGFLYGGTLEGPFLSRPRVHCGVYGAGLFQPLYRPAPAHWATLPGTLEWHAAAALCVVAGVVVPAALALAGAMVAASVLLAAVVAHQAPLPKQYRGVRARSLIVALSYVQPLVRAYWRYRTRLIPPQTLRDRPGSSNAAPVPVPHIGEVIASYWDEAWQDRTDLLPRIVRRLADRRLTAMVEDGWCAWDLRVHCGLWMTLRIRSVQEDHGSGRRLIRLLLRYRPSAYTAALALAGVVFAMLGGALHAALPAVVAGLLAAGALLGWRSGHIMAMRTAAVLDSVAHEMGLVPCRDEGRG